MLKALTIVILAELGIMVAAAVFAVVVGIFKKDERGTRLRQRSG